MVHRPQRPNPPDPLDSGEVRLLANTVADFAQVQPLFRPGYAVIVIIATEIGQGIAAEGVTTQYRVLRELLFAANSLATQMAVEEASKDDNEEGT